MFYNQNFIVISSYFITDFSFLQPNWQAAVLNSLAPLYRPTARLNAKGYLVRIFFPVSYSLILDYGHRNRYFIIRQTY